MVKLVAWLPKLSDWLSWGCTTSLLLKKLENDVELAAAREICLDMWTFVQDLPTNIATIRNALPENMQAASSLLADLADEELYYQQLFLKQCTLSGIAPGSVQNYRSGKASMQLKALLAYQHPNDQYENRLISLAVAELAATAFCRAALPSFESYFQEHALEFSHKSIAEGLEWMRVHARPQARNALLLLKTLGELKYSSQKDLPESAASVLTAMLDLWQCPARNVSIVDPAPVPA